MLTLKEWRRARGISQQDMADRLGVHINTYREWEASPAKIRMSDAQKIAEILKLEITDIIFLSENTTKCCD